MGSVDWARVQVAGFPVPQERPLTDLTAELTEMLGSPDPRVREEVAIATLRTWLRRGVYDDLLRGLGDGMAAGLGRGIGETGTDSVFRRCASSVVLGTCITRDVGERRLPAWKVLEWGDRLATWLLTEQDPRGEVPGKGPARAVARGADALARLAAHPHCHGPELAALLDVLGDRATGAADRAWMHGEADHLARATLQILRRELVPVDVFEAWLDRVAEAVQPATGGSHRAPTHDDAAGPANAAAYLRALYVHLSLAPLPPSSRADLLLLVVDQLRGAHPEFF